MLFCYNNVLCCCKELRKNGLFLLLAINFVILIRIRQSSSFGIPYGNAKGSIGLSKRLIHCRSPMMQSQTAAKFDETTIRYFGEGQWNETFVQTQQAYVPAVEIVSSLPQPLNGNTTHNMYYLLRHGQSTANVDEVISSDRVTLSYSNKHGLTDVGYQQGKESHQQLLEAIQNRIAPQQLPPSTTTDKNRWPHRHRLIMISSPFARARQTALACLRGLNEMKERLEMMHMDVIPSILIHNLLVERYFGKLDNEAIYTYAYVWPLDKFNVTHTAFDVESVAAVATRLEQLIQQLESNFLDVVETTNDDDGIHEISVTNHIVLVSHADVLQIGQLYAANAENIGEFSSYRFKSMLKCSHLREGMCICFFEYSTVLLISSLLFNNVLMILENRWRSETNADR
jgi:broad specificity phosphatase PhoE